MKLSDKAIKLLRLAMCDGATQSEGVIAAVMFVLQLKKDGVRPEQFEAPPVPKGFVRVKRDSADSPSSRAQSATSPVQTASRPSPAPKNNPYGAYEGEQLQWVYENRHRLSKKMRSAVEEEMEARGLL